MQDAATLLHPWQPLRWRLLLSQERKQPAISIRAYHQSSRLLISSGCKGTACDVLNHSRTSDAKRDLLKVDLTWSDPKLDLKPG